jgi:hypothetical protein
VWPTTCRRLSWPIASTSEGCLRFASSEGSNLSGLSMSAALGAVPLVVSDSELREAVALELFDFELPEALAVEPFDFELPEAVALELFDFELRETVAFELLDFELPEAVALELLDFALREPDEGDRPPDFRDLGEFAVASGTAPSPQVSLTCSAGSTFDRRPDFLHFAIPRQP